MSDAAITVLCRPPYSFTPRQVRDEFTLRDLRLLTESSPPE